MLHGLKYDFIEDLLINLRLLKPPPAVLAENGVMRYRIGQRKTNKPTVGDVDPDFLNEAYFRTNSVQITDQKHFEQHDRIDARTPIILTIQGAAFFRDKRKVDGFIDFSKQVILGNKVFYVDCFGLKFPGWVRPEHIKTFLRNCFIPNSTKKAVDPSLSTASGKSTLPGCFFPFRTWSGVPRGLGAPTDEGLQGGGRHQRGDQHDDHRRGEQGLVDQSLLQADGGDDKPHFPPGDHSGADDGGTAPVEPGQFGPQAAADQFGQDGHEGEDHDEKEHLEGEILHLCRHADADEKDRHKEREGHRFHLFEQFLPEAGEAEHQPGEIGADDPGHSEHFREIGKGEGGDDAEGEQHLGREHAGDGAKQPREHGPTRQEGDDEEEDDLHQEKQDARNASAAVIAGDKADDDRQGDDAQDVVQHGGTQDGDPFLGLKPSQFPQGLHRNADAGGHQHRSDKDGGGVVVAEQQSDPEAGEQGKDHPSDGRKGGTVCGAFEFVYIGFQAGEEHQQNDADFGQLAEHVALLDPSQEGGAEDHPHEQLAEDGGLSEPFAQMSR